MATPVFALDFTGPRLVRLSPNWATPIRCLANAAFLTFGERYFPSRRAKDGELPLYRALGREAESHSVTTREAGSESV